ncbi:MAG: hypothetical protein PWP47_619 [Synergistaceae bacterium]|nr:hypothetical protein [Synergistaceae bacterium]
MCRSFEILTHSALIVPTYFSFLSNEEIKKKGRISPAPDRTAYFYFYRNTPLIRTASATLWIAAMKAARRILTFFSFA